MITHEEIAQHLGRHPTEREHEILNGINAPAGLTAVLKASLLKGTAQGTKTSPSPKPQAQPTAKGECVHLGERIKNADGTLVTVDCPSCPNKLTGERFSKKALRKCGVHGQCVENGRPVGVASCSTCKDHTGKELSPPRLAQPKAEAAFSQWISTAQFGTDSAKLAGLLPADTSRIVGIPRSGMIAASIVATHLHLPLLELNNGKLTHLARGSRSFVRQPNGKTVVIDDTVYGGGAIAWAKQGMMKAETPAIYAAVYVTPNHANDVDFYARVLNHRSHLLEWNFFNNHGILRGGIATDMDGILCEDSPVPDVDEGPLLRKYQQWLNNATPKWLVRAQPVKLIVTARLERWRPETEAWLAKYGVRFEALVMHPAKVASQRGDVAAWKAEQYQKSATAFMVESDLRQAERIHQLTKKHVICPGASRVWRLS